MNTKDAWIQTYSGRKFNVFEPKADAIDLADIAHALSRICRYNGHCNQFFSVAQHSLFVAGIVGTELAGSKTYDSETGVHLDKPKHSQNVVAALLHDAAEAYLVDLPRPIKEAFGGYVRRRIYEETGFRWELGDFDPWKEIETGVERAVAERFGLDYPRNDQIKRADLVMLLTERNCLFDHPIPWGRIMDGDAKPLAMKRLAYMQPAEAEYQFITTARMLGIT